MSIILSETELRANCRKNGLKEVTVEDGTILTPAAKDFLREQGIRLIIRPKAQTYGVMPMSAGAKKGECVFIDAVTKQRLNKKPENMTHLRENLLVSKSHPRIALRGRLDSLEALIMEIQILCCEDGFSKTADELDEIFHFTQLILGSEVKETPVPKIELLGMDSDKLRYVSHHVREEIGIDHPVPNYRMGKVPAALNRLRTQVRETELAAVSAFGSDESRQDIIEALNRMSSCIYIIFCRVLKQMQGKGSQLPSAESR